MQSSWVLFLVSTLARCGLSLPVTPADQSIELILGNGCFFEQQYTAVQFEISHLRRTPQQITAVTGYAGGRKVPGDLCYHNAANVKDYGKAGFAEAVQLSVPSSAIGAAFVSWFGSMWAEFDVGRFARRDFYDVGAEYRAIVAFPGGTANEAVMKELRRANKLNLTLTAGRGSDGDTLMTNSVWVMDSAAFPLHQAELCLQFHDNTTAKYPAGYHALQATLLSNGKLRRTTCPKNYIC